MTWQGAWIPKNVPALWSACRWLTEKEDVTLRLSDVICLNRYYGWYSFCGELKEAQKALREELEWWNAQDRPIMMTEYGADTVAGLRDSTPVMFTEEYQVEYYKMYHEVFDTLDHFCW